MLAGEVDKRGHPYISGKRRGKIPDFIVHKAGKMSHNLAVMEVKTINNVTRNPRGLRKDLETIYLLINEAEYYRGILLIYGSNKIVSSNYDLGSRVKKSLNRRGHKDQKLKEEILSLLGERILVLWHKEQGKEPIQLTF